MALNLATGVTRAQPAPAPLVLASGSSLFARGLFLGDYQGRDAAGNDFLAFFSQAHGDDSASIFFRRVRP